MRPKIAAVALALVLGVSIIGAALAHGSGDPTAVETADSPSILDAKLTVVSIAATAEAQFGGEALSVYGESRNGQLLYDVALMRADGTKHDVWMDANGERVEKAGALNVDNPHIERDRRGGRQTDNEEGDLDPNARES